MFAGGVAWCHNWKLNRHLSPAAVQVIDRFIAAALVAVAVSLSAWLERAAAKAARLRFDGEMRGRFWLCSKDGFVDGTRSNPVRVPYSAYRPC